MRRKRPHRKRHGDQPLTEDQRAALIPAGRVNEFRAAHGGGVVIETRAASEKGAAMVTGEKVSTPVR